MLEPLEALMYGTTLLYELRLFDSSTQQYISLGVLSGLLKCHVFVRHLLIVRY